MRRVLILFCLGVLYSVPAFGQGEWHMVSKDKEKTAWAKEEKTLAPPFKATTYTLPSEEVANLGVEYFTYTKGELYMGFSAGSAGENVVLAFEPTAGSVQWKKTVPNSRGGIGNCPSVAGDYILSGGQGKDAPLVCFNRSDGSVNWSKSLGSLYTKSVTIDDNRVYFLTTKLYCLNIETGETLWNIDIEPYIGVCSPAIDDQYLYMTSSDSVRAFDKMSGDWVWSAPETMNLAISIDENNVYVTDTGRIRALKKSNGQEVWNHLIEGGMRVGFINGIAIDNDHLVYVLQYNKDSVGAIVSIDKSNGNQKWAYAFEDRWTYPPSIANGYAYVVDWWTKSLWGFDITNGDVAFYDDSKSYIGRPIIANGMLYALTSNRAVMGFVNDATPVEPLSKPSDFGLSVFPQPVQHSSLISFNLRSLSNVTLNVYNSLGQIAVRLHSGVLEPGTHTVNLGSKISANELQTGVYYVTLNVDGAITQKKITVLR